MGAGPIHVNRTRGVIRYKADGSSQTLPYMNTGRSSHACGLYTTSANSIVHNSCILRSHVDINCAGLHSGGGVP